MTVFNGKRWQIIMSMRSRFDYAEFLSACKAANIPPMDPNEYMHKIMLLEFGLFMFPDKTPMEAYLACNDWIPGAAAAWRDALPKEPSKQQESCCGGGAVL